MKTNTKITNIDGTSKRATLILGAEDMIKVFGSPEKYNSGDDKVKRIWVYETNDGKVITIYDYKEDREFKDINEWSVGGKNVTKAEAVQFIENQMYVNNIEEYECA